MPRLLSRAAACAVLALAAVASAWASSGRAVYAPAAVDQVKPLSPGQRAERRFLQQAAAHTRFHAEAARIALARSGDMRVRELATRLVRHQEAARPGLQRLLHARGMAMPLMSHEQLRLLKTLEQGGVRADRVFLEQVALRGLGEELRLYERMAPLAEDPALKAWIEAQLPGLRERLAQAQRPAQGRPAPHAPASSNAGARAPM